MNNLLHEYQISVEFLDVSGAEFLDLLGIRDDIAESQTNLTENEQITLMKADQLLIKNCGLIYQELSRFINLSNYREEKHIKPHQWWWYLDVLVSLPKGVQIPQKIA